MFGVLSVWAAAASCAYYTSMTNPEIFYKKIVFSPFVLPVMAAVPIASVYLYTVKQTEVSKAIYQRTVGHLTDR